METFGTILIVIGLIIAVVYGIILLIKAFQTHILWGLGSLFVPFVSLVFVIMHWDVAKKPFLMGLISIPFYISGTVMLPSGMAI